MTLLTRIWNDERIILCSDEQVNNEFGYPKGNKKTCKLIYFKDINSCIGISGFLKKNEFIFTEYLIELYSTNKPSNIIEFIDYLKDEIENNTPGELLHEGLLLFICSYCDYFINLTFYKCPITNKVSIVDPIVPEYQYSNNIKLILETYFGILIDEKSFDENLKYFDNIDFNFNYPSLFHENLIHSKIDRLPDQRFYAILYGSMKHFNFNNLPLNLINSILVDIICFSYKISLDISNKHSGKLSDSMVFNTIGLCNAIFVIEKDKSKSGFVFKANECNNIFSI